MPNFYFTFGHGHIHNSGVPLKDYYVVVQEETEARAREVFIERFAKKELPDPMQWATSYSEERFDKSFFPKGCLMTIRPGQKEATNDAP